MGRAEAKPGGSGPRFSRCQYPHSASEQQGRDFTETLDFMHDQGIAHCDVKPDNICIKIDDPTVIKLIDNFSARTCRGGSGRAY